MRFFKVAVDSITGIKGKQLLKGEVHREDEIYPGHYDSMLNDGLIYEAAEPKAETPAPVQAEVKKEELDGE